MRAGDDQTARKVAECDRKLAQYPAALDAGADPATVAAWITETEAEKASYALLTRRPAPRARISEAEVKVIVIGSPTSPESCMTRTLMTKQKSSVS